MVSQPMSANLRCSKLLWDPQSYHIFKAGTFRNTEKPQGCSWFCKAALAKNIDTMAKRSHQPQLEMFMSFYITSYLLCYVIPKCINIS